MLSSHARSVTIAALGILASFAAADVWAQSVSTNRVATHQLGFSGATVSVREDYQHTRWPVAHRTFTLRGPNGRVRTLPLHDGGAGNLDSLSLYSRNEVKRDNTGRTVDGEFVLLGVRDCVAFDPVFLTASRCITRPPCQGTSRPNLLYLGRFDWANGYDPPRGRFQFGWRFLPIEDGDEEPSCP